jgi:hypothetical protein
MAVPPTRSDVDLGAGVVLLGLDAPGPRDSWAEGTTPHFHSACYEGALGIEGGLGGSVKKDWGLVGFAPLQLPVP